MVTCAINENNSIICHCLCLSKNKIKKEVFPDTPLSLQFLLWLGFYLFILSEAYSLFEFC